MKKVYTASDLPDAYIVLNLVIQAGIEARVFNENAQGGLGEIPFTHAYPEVWVNDARDATRAQEIVKAHLSAPADSGVVFCRACGEENPRNFQLCWHCGAEL
jgi:hypothetical protein